MHSGPSKTTEALVALVVPPACREEVVGDLHERYRSPRQYFLDALGTVPLVIISRIRRTADPQVMLIHAFALYLSYLCAAWFQDATFLQGQWGLLRLAAPVAMVTLGLLLQDAYAKPGRQSALDAARGPLLGLGLAILSQAVLSIGDRSLAVPRWIMIYGSAMSLLLCSAVRLLFPPTADQLQGVNAPAWWLKRAGEPVEVRWRFVVVALLLSLALVYRLWAG